MLCEAVESCKNKLFSDDTNVMKARVDSAICGPREGLKESLSAIAIEVCRGITERVQKLICDIGRCKPLCPLSNPQTKSDRSQAFTEIRKIVEAVEQHVRRASRWKECSQVNERDESSEDDG